MSITYDDLESLCRVICPKCEQAWPLEQRKDTKEFVHSRFTTNAAGANNFIHTMCLATHLRNKHASD